MITLCIISIINLTKTLATCFVATVNFLFFLGMHIQRILFIMVKCVATNRKSSRSLKIKHENCRQKNLAGIGSQRDKIKIVNVDISFNLWSQRLWFKTFFFLFVHFEQAASLYHLHKKGSTFKLVLKHNLQESSIQIIC
jgi:hypothetical protein